MLFLIHGFIRSNFILFFLTSVQCVERIIEIDYGYSISYHYLNHSGTDLAIIAYDDLGEIINSWALASNEKLVFDSTLGGVGTPPTPFCKNIAKKDKIESHCAKKVVVMFQNEKCNEYKNGFPSERNIFNMEKYLEYEFYLKKNRKENDPIFNSHDFVLTWTFTPEDIAQAIDCDVL